MITYNRSAFGMGLMFRIHGSAIYRAMVPGFVSVAIFLLIRTYVSDGEQGEELGHPYAIGVVVSGTTFLIVFRASQGYSRYWEAASAAYHMMSKWMDATTHTACYHLQSAHYDKIKPPSFNDYHDLNALFLTRDRERVRDSLDDSENEGTNSVASSRTVTSLDRANDIQRSIHRSINAVKEPIKPPTMHSPESRRSFKLLPKQNDRRTKLRVISAMSSRDLHYESQNPLPLLGKPKPDGNWGALFNDGTSTFYNKNRPKGSLLDKKGFASTCGGRTPSLFLQELAHLSSLMNAVALSTLRNDVEGAESPLDLYEPGSPWPNVDPHIDNWMLREESSIPRFYRQFLHFLGVGRTAEERTRYNAARPLPVLGGVSDSEIRLLQMARGPYAKTQLCWSWLSEFITRESLNGTLGKVAPPIISRIIQFLGDGMTFYNHARKVVFIPFPFVHAQLSAFFVLFMIPVIPFLMDQYTDNPYVGCVLSFLTVTCLTGVQEVARELENPFRNIPNELPLVTLQAEYNETLLTMYSGYHPDLFWESRVSNLRRLAALQERTRSTEDDDEDDDDDDGDDDNVDGEAGDDNYNNSNRSQLSTHFEVDEDNIVESGSSDDMDDKIVDCYDDYGTEKTTLNGEESSQGSPEDLQQQSDAEKNVVIESSSMAQQGFNDKVVPIPTTALMTPPKNGSIPSSTSNNNDTVLHHRRNHHHHTTILEESKQEQLPLQQQQSTEVVVQQQQIEIDTLKLLVTQQATMMEQLMSEQKKLLEHLVNNSKLA